MAKIYCRKIKGGAMSIDQVPSRWRDEVLALLTEGCTESGNTGG